MATKPRVLKTRNGGTMTEAEYWGKLRSALRKSFRFWIPMKQALEAAKRPSRNANRRLKWEYQCSKCRKWFARAAVEIDHLIPCGSLRDWADIAPFIQRLTAEDPAAFQVLCKTCHRSKTSNERQTKAHGKTTGK